MTYDGQTDKTEYITSAADGGGNEIELKGNINPIIS